MRLVHVLSDGLALNGGTIRNRADQDADLSYRGSGRHTAPDAIGIAIDDARAREGVDDTVTFRVRLAPARNETVSVAWATEDGTAKAGEDYTESRGTVVFAPGETAKTIEVAILDDVHDEGEETFTVRLRDASPAYVAAGGRITRPMATATIANADAMPRAWIARFGRTVAEQVIEAVESRMRAPREAGAEASLAGRQIGLGPVFGDDGGTAESRGDAAARQREEAETARQAAQLADWLAGGSAGSRSGAGDPQERLGLDPGTATRQELMLGSSFSLTTAAEDGQGGTVSLWGRGAVSRFDGREGRMTLDGEVASGLVGADWDRDATTLGLILGHSRGEGGYRAAAGSGTVSSTLTGLYPWGRHALGERLSVWGIAGYGEGTLTLTPEGPDGESRAALRTDLDLMMGATGLRGVVVAAPETGGPELAVKSDALVGAHDDGEGAWPVGCRGRGDAAEAGA